MFLPLSLLQVVDVLLPISLLAGTAVASHAGFHVKQHGTGYRHAAGTGSLKADDINVTTTNDLAVRALPMILEVSADELSSIPSRSLSEANVNFVFLGSQIVDDRETELWVQRAWRHRWRGGWPQKIAEDEETDG